MCLGPSIAGTVQVCTERYLPYLPIYLWCTVQSLSLSLSLYAVSAWVGELQRGKRAVEYALSATSHQQSLEVSNGGSLCAHLCVCMHVCMCVCVRVQHSLEVCHGGTLHAPYVTCVCIHIYIYVHR